MLSEPSSSWSFFTVIGFAGFIKWVYGDVTCSFAGVGSIGKSDISALCEEDFKSEAGSSSVISTSSDSYSGVADSETYSSLFARRSSIFASVFSGLET